MTSKGSSQTFDTIIIGAGIAGLTAAYYLKQKNQKILLFEKQNTAGGNIKTLRLGDFLCETGPHSFMGSAEAVWKLVHDLNLSSQVLKASPSAQN
ncbi:MAG TPA: FAD-dependent oxidoreductase, partial [bacterium]|nr:FAD-dependent oxidoreductase [bacterium]